MSKIFISHTHSDREIADALNEAIRTLFGATVQVEYSTKKEAKGGIPHGTEDHIGVWASAANVALALGTPAEVVEYARRVSRLSPSCEQLTIIKGGLEVVGDAFAAGPAELGEIVGSLIGE